MLYNKCKNIFKFGNTNFKVTLRVNKKFKIY